MSAGGVKSFVLDNGTANLDVSYGGRTPLAWEGLECMAIGLGIERELASNDRLIAGLCRA